MYAANINIPFFAYGVPCSIMPPNTGILFAADATLSKPPLTLLTPDTKLSNPEPIFYKTNNTRLINKYNIIIYKYIYLKIKSKNL